MKINIYMQLNYLVMYHLNFLQMYQKEQDLLLHYRHTAIPGKAVLWLFLQISQTSETDRIQVLGYLDAVLNEVTKVRTMAYSNLGNEYHKAGPSLAVLTLQKEERMSVRHYSCQGHYSGDPITTFSRFSFNLIIE